MFKLRKSRIMLLLAGLLATAFLSFGAAQCSLFESDDDDNTGLLLLLGISSANSSTTSSGYTVTIPAGVAQ